MPPGILNGLLFASRGISWPVVIPNRIEKWSTESREGAFANSDVLRGFSTNIFRFCFTRRLRGAIMCRDTELVDC